MSEDSELQAKIAALAGRINVHKQQQQQPEQYQPAPQYGRGRGRGGWAPYRGTPYGAPRGRGGKVFNRTLVLNNTNRASNNHPAASASQNNELSANGSPAPSPQTNDAPGWVVKRDRHMQLINPAIYDQVAQQRAKAIEQTTEQRRQQRSMKEKAKLNKHFHAMQLHGQASPGIQISNSPQSYEIEIDNIRFRVADGGSKLVRISSTWPNMGTDVIGRSTKSAPDDPNTARATPKQARVGGVTFLRSKNGNLYRSGLIKTKQDKPIKKIDEPCPRFTTTGWPFPSRSPSKRQPNAALPGSYAQIRLTRTPGTCAKGPQCRYVHDPNKVAICKDYLLRGNCALGDGCDLSHEPTPNRVPACLHFLRGNCTNDNCRYAHIRVNPSGPVCHAFGALGYCEKGSDCTERHVFECPDYANHAVCRNPKCRLPHVDRAGQIRKAAAAHTASAELGSPDLSSDDEYNEIDSDDVDSEDEIEGDVIMQGADDHGRDLSQQQDFVSF